MSAAVLLGGQAVTPVSAQLAVPPPAPEYQPFSDQQLDQLLGPIALYPDPLLAQILPAATLPAQIVMADRYLTSGGDPNLAGQQPWDTSVQALVRYPAVLKYLDDNLTWTTELGEAFVNQQPDVMASVQRLRLSAQNMGNLQSTPQQQVVNDGGDVEILPADPNVIYVPVYQPDEIFYQTGFGLGFGVGCAIGPWLNCDFDWAHHNLFVWNHDHGRPANWWHERPDQRDAYLTRQGTPWHPDAHRPASLIVHGDRGWNNGVTHPVVTPTQSRIAQADVQRQEIQRQQQLQAAQRQHTVQAPVIEHNTTVFNQQRTANTVRPENNGAFIGNDSTRDARNFSNRGQQSMQTVPHSEPAHVEPAHVEPAHSAPAPSFQGGGGGGGGFHGGGGGGGGSQPRH